MRNIYENGTYLDNNPTWHEEYSPWKARQIIHMIKKNDLKPTTICEIGCGSGEILNQLSRQLSGDINYYGYEISKDAFAICQNKSKSNLRFYFEDLLKKHDAKYDIVMAIDVMEHIEDYYGFIRNLKHAGEYKIFHIPLDLSVQTVLRVSPLIKARTLVGHIHYFTKETALASLEDTEYEIIDYFYTRGSLELPNRGWKANMLKIPRKLFFAISQDLAVRIMGGFSLLVLAK